MEKKVLKKRLKELKGELATGQQQMHELDKRRDELQSTLLRISGAIQVLEELLAQQAEE